MKEPYTEFGQRLRSYRHKNGLSMQDLAEAVGIHPTYIGKLEAGNQSRGPSVAVVYRLAQLMEADPDELLRLAGKVDRERLLRENERLRQRVAELETQLARNG